jgi:hypothetical protein
MRAWGVYEDALTARLGAEDVKRVNQAVIGLTALSDAMAKRPRPDARLPYTPVTATADVRRVREEATAAYNALAHLAEETRIAGLLHE